MKKSFKVAAVMTMVAIMTTGMASAREMQRHEKPNMRGENKSRNEKQKMPRIMPNARGEMIIGQVKSVDEKNASLTIADADGKESTFVITPFTHVLIQKGEPKKMRVRARPEAEGNAEKKERPPRPSISDVNAGDWVMISTFKTETKSGVVQTIFVKGTESEKK